MHSTTVAASSTGRQQRRQRALLGGVVTFADGAHSFRCTIRNFSADGARITLPDDRLLPPRLYLINLNERAAYEALTVWKRDGEAGVALLDRLPLAELSDPKLSYLDKLWQGSMPRLAPTDTFI
jgi:hypothetical protein